MPYADTQRTRKANRKYIDRTMKAAFLTRERERELAQRWRDERDERALHELIAAHGRLVVKLAGRFRNYGLPMSDLVQEGNVGLLEAASRFDPEREVRFSTYASWWIRATMQEFVLRNWSIVRTGTTAAQKSLFFNLRRLRAKYADDVGGWLDRAATGRIAGELRVRVEDVEDMEMRLAGGDLSLHAPVGDAGDEEWEDFLTDDRATPEENFADKHDSRARSGWLAAALRELGPRESTIIRERRLRENGATLNELGKKLGVSKERVRQIEHAAIAKLRAAIGDRCGEALAAA